MWRGVSNTGREKGFPEGLFSLSQAHPEAKKGEKIPESSHSFIKTHAMVHMPLYLTSNLGFAVALGGGRPSTLSPAGGLGGSALEGDEVSPGEDADDIVVGSLFSR